MRVAVDAMGGDLGPGEIVRGALQAAGCLRDVEIILVGNEAEVQAALAKSGPGSDRVSVRHASQIVAMGESPVEALRQKGDSSIVRAVELVADGEADAVVSAGNTGAAVVAATLSLRLLKGVRRPGIAVGLPTQRGTCTVIDVGANINCRPKHLFQYGIMASVLVQYASGRREKPSVGLLNVGEENAKGTDLIKETYALLRDSNLNFIGNVEGRDIYRGNCDVVVCDGFVGNTILKVSEGLSEALFRTLRDELTTTFWRKMGAWFCRNGLRSLKMRTDYSEYGGASLLGVDGVVVIAHGRSNARAIENAVRRASEMSSSKVNHALVEAVRDGGGR